VAEKNSFGVEMKTMADKKKEEAKVLQADSIFAHLDTDGDGVITDEEMARAKEIAEFEHKRKMQENEDAKEAAAHRPIAIAPTPTTTHFIFMSSTSILIPISSLPRTLSDNSILPSGMSTIFSSLISFPLLLLELY
jgi:hypothetical protein